MSFRRMHKMPTEESIKKETTQKIKTKAKNLGFDLVGITQAETLTKDYSFFKWWLEEGFGAELHYLYRNQEKREDPSHVLKNVQSIICVGMNYYTKPSKGTISNYAWGHDYHDILLEKLKKLSQYIKNDLGIKTETKEYVDTGAILERSYAAQAGLGWIGKNTCLINKEVGSYVFLGEILTDLELEYDEPITDHCGSCTACLDACPTHAFNKEGVLDSNKCISYLTIEYRGEDFPENLKSKMGTHIVGCDICQAVCPWNRKAPETTEKYFYPRDGFLNPSLTEWKNISEQEFSQKFKKSPIKRVKWRGLMRNLKNALLNQHS